MLSFIGTKGNDSEDCQKRNKNKEEETNHLLKASGGEPKITSHLSLNLFFKRSKYNKGFF